MNVIDYVKAINLAYYRLHNIPFKGNEEYWRKRIFAFELMNDLHEIQRMFDSGKDKIPVDIYLHYKTKIDDLKGLIKQKLYSIPFIDTSLIPVENEKKIWEKIEKI